MTYEPMMTTMFVLEQTKEAVYLRLPEALQRSAGICNCAFCGGQEGKWDTLVVPVKPGRNHTDAWTYTVHLPDKAVQGFRQYNREHGLAA